jgi:hypothetical protein
MLDPPPGLAQPEAGLAQPEAGLAQLVPGLTVGGLPGLEQPCRKLLTFALRLTNGKSSGDSP